MKTRFRSARRFGIYALIYVVLVAGYPSLVRPLIRREISTQLTTSLASAIVVTAGEVDSWARAHRLQALTLGRVAQLELEHSARNAGEGAAFERDFSTMLDSLKGISDFTDAWVLKPGNVVLARTSGSSAPPSGATPILVTRAGSGEAVVEFSGEPAGARGPRVILRSRLRAQPFSRLDPTSNRSARTTKTAILLHAGDSVHVVVGSARATEGGRRSYAVMTAPAPFVRALRGPPAAGLAIGSGGVPAYYATGRIGSLGLPIVREVDESEVLAQLRGGLVVQGALVAALLLGLVYLFQSRWQAAQIRREREMMRVRDDFVSSVSHELRTPLTQIRMYAELMRTGSMRGEADTARALNVIEKEARRLAILVDNVLNFSRLKRRTQQMNEMVTDVECETREVIVAFSPLAAERGVLVSSEVPPGMHARMDSLALRQVLLNLLENAVKYGPRNQRVVIGADANEHTVRIWVDDEGAGIPAAERDRVWEPFYRGQGGVTNDVPGSGIGLSVVQDLVVRHGGDVAVSSSPAGGARLELRIPHAHADQH